LRHCFWLVWVTAGTTQNVPQNLLYGLPALAGCAAAEVLEHLSLNNVESLYAMPVSICARAGTFRLVLPDVERLIQGCDKFCGRRDPIMSTLRVRARVRWLELLACALDQLTRAYLSNNESEAPQNLWKVPFERKHRARSIARMLSELEMTPSLG
jgi:hypothetical protein